MGLRFWCFILLSGCIAALSKTKTQPYLPTAAPTRITDWDPLSVPRVYRTMHLPEEYHLALCLAVSFWKYRGHPIEGCDAWPEEWSPYGVDNTPQYGIILVDLATPTIGESTLGVTWRDFEKGGCIERALIEIRPGLSFAEAEWVFEHEIGHALGYNHVENPAHLMNWYYAGGRGDEGLWY